MGKFLLGLVIGVIVGVLAMTYNPNLPEEVRAGLAGVTALVMRGTERAADAVGEAADEVADEAGEAVEEQPGEPGAVVEQPAPEAPPPATE
jgi:gas vesicle protein